MINFSSIISGSEVFESLFDYSFLLVAMGAALWSWDWSGSMVSIELTSDQKANSSLARCGISATTQLNGM
jgi:hypothetical protein